MNRNLILVAISMLIWGIGEGLFYYFQPIYLEQLGADPVRIGAILGAVGIMMTVSHIPAGYLSDRIGRKPLMVAAWFSGIVATWTMAVANTLTVFVAGMLFYGFTLFVLSPLNSYVTAARGKWSVGRAFTFVGAAFNLGGVIGPIAGGQIGDLIGLRTNFFIAGILFIVSTTLIIFIRPQPVEPVSQQVGGNSWMQNQRYLGYLGVVFLAVFATYIAQPLTPNFLHYERDLSLSKIGPLYAVSGIGTVVLNLLLGSLSARVGFLIAQSAVALFSLILWQATGFPAYLLGFFLLGGFKTTRALATAQVRTLVHQAKMGLAYGLTETISSTATILAPILAGLIYAREPIGIYIVSIGLILLSFLVSARYSPNQDSDASPQEANENRVQDTGI
jgi:DHA1 family multidrug resistance protein-like MFS transporter